MEKRHFLTYKYWYLAVFIIAATLTAPQLKKGLWPNEGADTVYLNGQVLTINPAQPSASAVAVKDGRIMAVGTNVDMQPLITADTHVISLQGKALLPGFIEPHTHPLASAILSELVDVSGFTNPQPEDVYNRLRQAVAQTEEGEWILAFGLDPLLSEGIELPDREILDKIAPKNPVFILSQIMHTAYVNSLALELSSINDDVTDPVGGHFERDEAGKLTGIVHESAIGLVKYRSEGGWLSKIQEALKVRSDLIGQYQRYADAGYTTIGVPGPVPMFDGYLAMLEHVGSRQASPIRSFVYPMADEMEKTDYQPGYMNGKYSVIGVKIYLDGSPWTGAMATAQPYLVNEFTQNVIKMKKDNRGILKESPESLLAKVEQAHQQGWQVAIHTHGERAHDMALDTIDSVQQKLGKKNLRHRLEHLGLITEQSLIRAKSLDVTPSFFIDHVYYFGNAVRDKLLGEERAERFMPLAWASKYHDRVTIHTDNPATPLGAMRALRTAVTRIPRFEQQALNTQQKMTVQNALESITIDAAWQMHAEDEIGSIEVGKRADFTLLSTNPLQLSPESWLTIKPLATWVDGEQVSGEVF